MSKRSSGGGGWRSAVRRGGRGSSAVVETFTRRKGEAETPPTSAATAGASDAEGAAETPPTSRNMSSSSSLRVVESFRVTSRVTLLLAKGSVLDFVPRHAGGSTPKAPPLPSAIVNAANPGCLGGGGVDGAITDAGGPNLAKDRRKLPVVRSAEGLVRCPTGTAVRTGPNKYGDLPTPYVIHAVGPNYNDFCSYANDFVYGYNDNEDPFRRLEGDDGWGIRDDDGSRMEQGHALLRSAYQSSLDRAWEVRCHQVAFSLLSAGVYRGPVPLPQIFELTAASIQEWAYRHLDDDDEGDDDPHPPASSPPVDRRTANDLNNIVAPAPPPPMEVILCAYSPSECQTLVEACRRVFAT